MFKEANTAIFSSNQLVISYLIHHGYTKTASALVKNSKGLSSLYADRGGLIGCGDGIEQRTCMKKKNSYKACSKLIWIMYSH